MISYLFLGWLFLLARKNPDFSHPFVRSHAKSATKAHIGLLGGYLVYRWYLAQYIPGFSVPGIPTLTIDKIIGLCFFVVLAIFIIRGAYLAHKGATAEEASSQTLKEAFRKENITLETTGETDKMIFLSSYIPLLGIVTAARHENPITRTGTKVGSVWIFLIILLTSFG